jgi:hypothetical protein
LHHRDTEFTERRRGKRGARREERGSAKGFGVNAVHAATGSAWSRALAFRFSIKNERSR